MLHIVKRAELSGHIIVTQELLRIDVEGFAQESGQLHQACIRGITEFTVGFRMAAFNGDRVIVAVI